MASGFLSSGFLWAAAGWCARSINAANRLNNRVLIFEIKYAKITILYYINRISFERIAGVPIFAEKNRQIRQHSRNLIRGKNPVR